MSRRTNPFFEMIHLTNAAEIFRESMRVLFLHPSHFHSISIFLFSPLPTSLFFSHILIHYYPHINSSFTLPNYLFAQNGANTLIKFFSRSIIHIVICFPSYITFNLFGRATIIHTVADSYNGVNLSGKRLFKRSKLAWVKLLNTCFWEFFIVCILFGFLVVSLATVPKILLVCGICSSVTGFWYVLGLLGIPFCVGFAHIMVVGNLARVLTVLEGECYGFKSLVKAKGLIEGRRQTTLVMALLSNIGLRLIELLFEFRLGKGMNVWESFILVSMYSMVLVLETIMNVVFYYTCKTLSQGCLILSD